MRFALRLVVAVVAFGVVAAPASGQTLNKRMDRLFASPNQAINSDFAFWGDHAFSGYYTGDTGTPVGTAPRGGVRIFDISNPAAPRLVKNLQCDGLQADPFVWDRNENGVADLLLVAVDRTMSGPDCGDPRSFKPDGTAFHEDPNGWEGVRVFEMSDDPANPFATITQVDAQYTDCGAHTITGWTGRAHDAVDPHLIVYVSSYPLRPGPTCGQTGSTETPPYANTNNPFDDDPVENDPLHRQIQILKVPLDNPADTEELEPAEISYEHAAMPDPDGVQDWTEKGLTGLEPAAIACHDIVTHMEHNIAGAACAEQGQVWEIDPATGIPDTMNPMSIGDDEVSSGGAGQLPGAVDFFHSVMFNNDGTIVNWVDESFGSGCPTMTTYSPRPHNPAGGTHKTGSMFFTDMEGNFLSEFNVGDVRPDTTEGEYCSAHMGMTVAGIKKDLLVNAWYTGGTDVIDFSKPTRLKEIAYYDPDTLTGHWSSYPYTGPLFRKRGGVPVYVSDGVEDPLNAQGMEVYRAKIKTPSRRNLMDHMNPQTMDHGLMMGGGGDDDDDDDDDRGGGRDD
jgi:hypothetical protein